MAEGLASGHAPKDDPELTDMVTSHHHLIAGRGDFFARFGLDQADPSGTATAAAHLVTSNWRRHVSCEVRIDIDETVMQFRAI
jgi:hypothetical protein